MKIENILAVLLSLLFGGGFLLKQYLHYLDGFYGPAVDTKAKKTVDDLWIYLEQHSFRKGLHAAFLKLVWLVRKKGGRLVMNLIACSFLVNVFLALYGGYLDTKMMDGSVNFIQYTVRLFQGKYLFYPLLGSAEPLTYWEAQFWPVLITTQIVSLISIWSSWILIKWIAAREQLRRVLVGVLLNSLINAFLLSVTFAFILAGRMQTHDMTLRKYYDLYHDIIRLYIEVKAISWVCWLVSASFASIISFGLLFPYLCLFALPNRMTNFAKHLLNPLTRRGSPNKTVFSQLASALNWTLITLGILLGMLGIKAAF